LKTRSSQKDQKKDDWGWSHGSRSEVKRLAVTGPGGGFSRMPYAPEGATGNDDDRISTGLLWGKTAFQNAKQLVPIQILKHTFKFRRFLDQKFCVVNVNLHASNKEQFISWTTITESSSIQNIFTNFKYKYFYCYCHH
jgi:hypothetical protein